MKKSVIVTCVIIMLQIFTSCTDDEKLQTESKQRISEVLDEENVESQRLMYSLLTKNEKFEIWESKLNKLISNDNFNTEQIKLIKELKSHFTINLFDSSIIKNDEKEIFKNIIVPKFLEEAKDLFTYETIYNSFFTIGDGGEFSSLDLTGQDPLGKPNCTCNKGSLFSCAGIVEDCQTSRNCRVTADGCGFATMFECNGKCYIR